MTAGQAPGGCTSGEPALAHANLQHWLDFFCSSAVTEASLGVIQPLTGEEACGFLGCMVVETGEPELDNLDVVEAGSGAGRGAMQYTGVRRTAYDAARSQAISDGTDPNSNDWQEQYFAEEYAGLHDPPEGSLIGWTRVFEDRPAGMDPAAAAAYWTGSAAEAEGYFRPGTPHTERRQAEALRVWGLLQSGALVLSPVGAFGPLSACAVPPLAPARAPRLRPRDEQPQEGTATRYGPAPSQVGTCAQATDKRWPGSCRAGSQGSLRGRPHQS